MSRNRAGSPGLRILVMLLILAIAPLASAGCGQETPLDLPAHAEEPAVGSIPGLSADQSRMVEELGYPDHFFLSIDPESSDRIERWTYFAAGKEFEFVSGRLSAEEAIEDQSARYPPTDLRPQDFDTMTTPEEATQLLGEPLYTREAEDGLLPSNTIVVFEQAVLLYHNGQLIGVDTEVSPPELVVP